MLTMKDIQKGALGAAFLVATDLAVAATTGFTGIHGIVIDLGAQFGDAVGMPQLDWHELLGLEEIQHAEHAAEHIDHTGHDHTVATSENANCHYEPNGDYHCGSHDEPTLEF